jgi:FAD/FMN-containing dehydrogenase
MIGNNSCGAHSVMAGKTIENISRLEVLTYDGARFWFACACLNGENAGTICRDVDLRAHRSVTTAVDKPDTSRRNPAKVQFAQGEDRRGAVIRTEVPIAP